MEVVAIEELVLRGRRAAHEDAVHLVAVRDEQVVRHARDLLVEVVDGLQAEAGEPLGGLATLALLARDQRRRRLDRFDALAPEPADVGLPPVQNDQAEQSLVLEHPRERFEEELRVAVIPEGLDGLWRVLEDPRDHVRPAAAAVDGAREQDHPVLGRLLVVLEAVLDALEGVLDVRPGVLGLDVGGLGVLLGDVGDDVRDLLVGRNVDGDELRAGAAVVRQLLDDLLELVFLFVRLDSLGLAHHPELAGNG